MQMTLKKRRRKRHHTFTIYECLTEKNEITLYGYALCGMWIVKNSLTTSTYACRHIIKVAYKRDGKK